MGRAAKRRHGNGASLQLLGLFDLRQSDEVVDWFRDVIEKALDAAAAHGGGDDARVVRDVIQVAGKQGGDGRGTGDLHQLHIQSLGAKETALAGGKQRQLLK